MPRQPRATISLTRLYTTATGRLGVCYAYADGRKGATLLPARLDHKQSIKRHLEMTLSVTVAGPNRTLQRFYRSELARLAAAINPSSQVRMLAMGRASITKLSTPDPHTIQARVKSQAGQKSYIVTLTKPTSKGEVSARCTCEAHRRSRHVTCKHIGALCLTLMMRLDLGSEREGGTHGLICVTEAGYGLTTGLYRHTHTRGGCVRLVGADDEARWVSAASILITQAIPSYGDEDAFLEVATPAGTPMPAGIKLGHKARETRHA